MKSKEQFLEILGKKSCLNCIHLVTETDGDIDDLGRQVAWEVTYCGKYDFDMGEILDSKYYYNLLAHACADFSEIQSITFNMEIQQEYDGTEDINDLPF